MNSGRRGPSEAVDPERELTRLRRQLAHTRADAAAQREALRENERLRQLIAFAARPEGELLPALVVGRGADRFGEVLTLGRGEADGVFRGQTVLGLEGLIGVVTGTEREECWVRTLRHGGLPISGRLADARILLAIEYRTHDPDGSSSTAAQLGGLADLATSPDIAHIELSPLTEAAAFDLLEHVAGGRRIATEAAELILRRSGGNPLYAMELYRHL